MPGEDDELAALEDNTLGRLLTLCDGVFAIAMTLLALDLRVPDDLAHPTSQQLWHALRHNGSGYLSFLVSFYVVAAYWQRHRRLMRHVTASHPSLIRDTLVLLLIVSAMPFFSSLLGDDGSTPLALALYGAWNALAVLTLLLLGRDIRRHELRPTTAETRDAHLAQWVGWRNLVIFLLCIPAGFVLGSHGPLVLLLLSLPNDLSVLWRWRRRPGASPASPV